LITIRHSFVKIWLRLRDWSSFIFRLFLLFRRHAPFEEPHHGVLFFRLLSFVVQRHFALICQSCVLFFLPCVPAPFEHATLAFISFLAWIRLFCALLLLLRLEFGVLRGLLLPLSALLLLCTFYLFLLKLVCHHSIIILLSWALFVFFLESLRVFHIIVLNCADGFDQCLSIAVHLTVKILNNCAVNSGEHLSRKFNILYWVDVLALLVVAHWRLLQRLVLGPWFLRQL